MSVLVSALLDPVPRKSQLGPVVPALQLGRYLVRAISLCLPACLPACLPVCGLLLLLLPLLP